MRDYFGLASPIRFTSVIDGDCVNSRDGRLTPDGLILSLTLAATAGHSVTVNGNPARETAPGTYETDVLLRGYRNSLTARDETDGTEYTAAVFRMPGAEGHYRLSSDDNILFLQDLTEHPGRYPSLFDHPYLAVYKKAHDLYGAKVHLNLFYALDAEARKRFSGRPRDFDLSMMTDAYREEFRRNAHWLKLAFHARAEFPDAPYRGEDAARITDDCIAVCREIVRFAGEECISNSTTAHWGSANREAVRSLRALGMRSLTGYLTLGANGNPSVSYYLSKELVQHLDNRDFWVDTAEDMIFGRIDKVLNLDSLEKVQEDVRDAIAHPHRGGFVSVMIHEQYFYPDYRRHLPDFEQRVLSACRILAEAGYTGAHISDVTAEPDLRQCAVFHRAKESL